MNTGVSVIFLSILGVVLSQCGTMIDNKVSEHDAKTIVDKHNELRKIIANKNNIGQPKAVNLKRLKYDGNLANEAQKIANTCIFAHKAVHDGRWHGVGQNLYIKYSTAPNQGSDWSGAVQSWFDEYKDYKFGPCCGNNFEKTGHYTQVVWADTEYVGCGYAYFNINDFWRYRKLYVCNYGPAGNYYGQLPYKTGDSGCENLC